MIDRWILITCSLLTFKYPEISNVHIIDWSAIPYFFLMAKKKPLRNMFSALVICY